MKPHRRDMSYAVALANRGFDEEQIARALAAPERDGVHRGSEEYWKLLKTRGARAAEAYARRTAERAVAFVRENPAIRGRPEGVRRVLEIRAAADRLPWFTYGGPRARRVLEAALLVGLRVGSVSFGLALREWAELAGVDIAAVRAERRVLEDLGWIARRPADRGWRTGRYRLRPGLHIHTAGLSLIGGGANVPGYTQPDPSHDAFDENALGDSGWYLMNTITRARASVAEIALRTGLDLEDADEWIRRLEALGLVVMRGATVEPSADLAERLGVVAETLGTAGAGEIRRERHRQEREAFRARHGVATEVSV
ncbi:MAG TPA: hypothetical protein VNO79_07855 [Actinomycetota bacterium]|nr:hypothetical protein [Actinomycetota bacterium]